MATNNTETLDLNKMSLEVMREKLEELGLPLIGSKSVVRERLRGALEDTENANDGGNDGDNDESREQLNVDALSKNELVVRLRELSLKTTGTKPELRTRLKAALDLNDNESENSDNDDRTEDSEHGEEDDNGEGEAAVRQTHQRRNMFHHTLTYKDVEDTLETFSGDGTQNFNRWLKNFEETAELCSWSDVQKVIYAKRLLKGSAKLFVSFECNASSWKKLKKALADEFSTTISSKQVHRELSTVKKNPMKHIKSLFIVF